MAERLTEGLTKAFQAAEIPSSINRVGSMFTGFFNDGPVTTLEDAEGSDTEIMGDISMQCKRTASTSLHLSSKRGLFLPHIPKPT
ncbi:MAG: hypothetical protein Ct9H300mP11_05480 [Chloroflexota bacterium]|nr:MAG: hypothetical protein Ct9H300mP11_05480 [Chloroflexota bacterium]